MADLKVTEVDFDAIKTNLKNFLKDQSTFQDYDFEGAGMSVLLDILAYNTHYLGIYGNMFHNEQFLDSAITRNAVVSRAKELGYTPRSYNAPKAVINVTFLPPGNPNPAIIERNTKFTTEVDGETFVFVTSDATSVTPVASVYSADIEIFQGQFISQQYEVDLTNADNRFEISNDTVDKQFLVVKVKPSASSADFETWTLAETLVGLDGDSKVFYLQMNHEGKYEVTFGDGVLGKRVESGNIINLEYLITKGSAANGAAVFTKVSNVANSTDVTISTVTSAANGSEPETLESIKLLAPKIYQTQERAITEEDYKALLLRDFPKIDALAVWGGEKNVPPYYGKVFIAIRQDDDRLLTNTEKEEIKESLLANHNVLAIRPEVIDPSYLFVNVTTKVDYNFRKTELTSGQIETAIITAIKNFFSTQLTAFKSTLYFSKFTAAIDDIGEFIIGNTTELSLQVRPAIIEGAAPTQYTLNFSNALQPSSLTSDTFMKDGIAYLLRDVPSGTAPYTTGVVQIYRKVGDSVIVLTSNAGSVNYNTGVVVLNDFSLDAYVEDYDHLRVTSRMAIDNGQSIGQITLNVVTNNREQLIALNEDSINVTVNGLKLVS